MVFILVEVSPFVVVVVVADDNDNNNAADKTQPIRSLFNRAHAYAHVTYRDR